jgi:alpha-beta hydrolase superfamily lysophospholipase
VSTAPASRPQYLDLPAGPVFSVFHAPAAGAGERLPAVLFCAPWGWNQASSYHALRDWAEDLAAAGHPVLRFDLPAVGDSAAGPADADLVATWVEAVAGAARWLADAAPGRELVALGMELGGLLALTAAREGAPIDALALWATPRDGRGFVRLTQAFSRMQAWGAGPDGDSPLPEGWVEAAGFVLSAETIAALKALKPAEAEPPARVRRALVLGREEALPEPSIVELLERGGAAVEPGPGSDWDVLVSHPGLAIATDAVRERFAAWLGAGGGSEPATPAASAPAGEAVATSASAELTAGGVRIRETPLDFLPAESFAILAEPAEPAAADAECTVFFNSANLRHIGPDRIWVDAARELAAAGVRSVRLDLAGIGEAAGESARFAEVAEFYDPAFGAQATKIIDALEAAGVASRFRTVGLCSGGYWAFRSALKDPRVTSALLLNPGALRWRPTLVMERDGKGAGLLLQPRQWGKLLRGEFDRDKIRAYGKLLRHRLAEGKEGRDPELEAELDRLRDAGTSLKMAFSHDEMDQELEALGILAQLDERWPNVSVTSLPGVDHALASTSAQAAARELIRAD